MNRSLAGRASKIEWICMSSWFFGTGCPLTAKLPSWVISSTIWVDGPLCGAVTGGGTWTSSAIRASGCEIMKMISSTSRMSIIGMTLGSELTSPDRIPPPPAIVAPLLLPDPEQPARLGLGLGDRRHHPHSRAPGGLHRLLDLAVFEVLVRPEVHDLVLRPGGINDPQLVLERLVRNVVAVEEVAAARVDAQHDLVLALRPLVEVLPLRHLGLEAVGDQRGHDHEDDQQHQHDVDHRNDVRLRFDRGLARDIN